MKKGRNAALDYAVYLLVRLVVGLGQGLSIEQSYAWRRMIASLIYRVDRRHRGRDGEPPSGVRRPLRRGRAGRDRPGGLPALLHDADGDPPHPPQAPPDDLEGSDHAGRPRGHRRSPAPGGAGDHAHGPLRQLGDGGVPVRRLRVPAELGGPGARQPLPRPLPPVVPRADGPEADPQDRRLRPDARRPSARRRPLVPGGPGRRPERPVRRLLRPARLDAQGDRAAGPRALRPGRHRLRPEDRAGVPLRGRLLRDHRSRRVRGRPTTSACSPSGSPRRSRPRSVATPTSTSGSIAVGSTSPSPGSGSRQQRPRRPPAHPA